jgi:ABC-2 type transport system ATP-binding protein
MPQFPDSDGLFLCAFGIQWRIKTTTLRMLAGLLPPDQGDALILGHSITRQPEAAKQVMAYVPDEPALYSKLRPMEYLKFVAGLWQVLPSRAMPYAQELLERFFEGFILFCAYRRNQKLGDSWSV